MDQGFIKKEKALARELRKSRWWQNYVSAGACCYYCEAPLQPIQVTMDHVVPISRGGRSNRGNVVAACKPCNTRKRDRTAAELTLGYIALPEEF